MSDLVNPRRMVESRDERIRELERLRDADRTVIESLQIKVDTLAEMLAARQARHCTCHTPTRLGFCPVHEADRLRGSIMPKPTSAPLRTPWTVYRVAPCFPDGYGGATTHESEEEAMATRESLISRGYGIVHVWKVTTEWIAR